MIGKLIGAVLMVMSAVAAPLEWMTDLEDAGKRAEAEGKLLLVEFTGSDWCRACLLQKKAVLSDAAFEAWAEQHCIAVEIDVPNDAARVGSEMQKILNRRICEEYGIYRFPTLRIMTADLVDVGGYSGALGSAAAAIGELEKAFPPAEQVEQALRKTGAERAAALCAIYGTIPQEERSRAFPLLQLIAEADPQNTTGMLPLYEQQQQIRRMERHLLTAVSPEERFLCVDATLKRACPGNEAYLRTRKGEVMREYALHLARHAQTLQDVRRARELMQQSVDYIPPQEQAQLKHFIEVYFARPEAFLEKAKIIR